MCQGLHLQEGVVGGGPSQIAAITQHGNMQQKQQQQEQQEQYKHSSGESNAILCGENGKSEWEWEWDWKWEREWKRAGQGHAKGNGGCSTLKFYVTFASHAETAEKCQRNKLQKLQKKASEWERVLDRQIP